MVQEPAGGGDGKSNVIALTVCARQLQDAGGTGTAGTPNPARQPPGGPLTPGAPGAAL